MNSDINKVELNIKEELFKPASKEEKTQLVVMRESTTYWKDVWKKLKSNKVAIISLYVIILITLLAIVGPMLSPYSYSDQFRGEEHQTPNAQHWFGTDYLGRDLFVRVLYGTRISLSIGIVASIMVLVIGTVYGAIAGYFGGKVDNIMMRFAEVLSAVPSTLMVILLSVVLKEPLKEAFNTSGVLKHLSTIGPGLISIFITFALLYWVDMARIVRGQVLSLKEQEYVTAAKALGGSSRRIIFKHLIPNSIGQITVTATLEIPSAIFTESFLSFIGLGVDAPMASLGSLTASAMNGIYSYPYQLIFPALFISIIILAFNLLGDGLRDALDPRMKK
ncbi:ABC transporter permease [Clostridium thermosuccinogenes]|nr:ABC transporter permease [Pseudoclostridium thermosuccinogenes]